MLIVHAVVLGAGVDEQYVPWKCVQRHNPVRHGLEPVAKHDVVLAERHGLQTPMHVM